MAITDIHQMTLSGGAACLDFINSGLEIDHAKVERLHHYDDLLVLTERLELMNAQELHNLRKLAEAVPKSATSCLEQAVNLREVLYQIFSAIADPGALDVGEKYLSLFNAWRGEALAAQAFSISDNQLTLGFYKTGETLVQPLWAFVLSANELLQGTDLQYIRRCSGCDWLFCDRSKSHRRKWCDMQTCGSSAKAKRYYQRKKASAVPSD